MLSRISAGIAAAVFVLMILYGYLKPTLPDVAGMLDIQLKAPLRIYSRDGRLMAIVGDQRRLPLSYEQLPPRLIQAFLATEDDRFFEHHGVDWPGILRAAVADLKAGKITQGGSTITMQLARNVFLTPQRDVRRKISEIYLALLMETKFNKRQILLLYFNKIYLGQRAYGVGAAAEIYFGKTVDQLDLAEMATLAGIPAAPSIFNPGVGAAAARARRMHVLRRMRRLKYITQGEFEQANSSPMDSRLHGPVIELDAPYVAAMVSQHMKDRYGEQIFNCGCRVYTTIDSRLQRAATVAMRAGLLDYDRRHGWRGPAAVLDPSVLGSADRMDRALAKFPVIGGLQPAIVRQLDGKTASIHVAKWGNVMLTWDQLSWAHRPHSDAVIDHAALQAADIVRPGDVIYTVGSPDTLQFVQVPQAQSALVSLDPADGAVVALVGGFDFAQSNFNRVTQSRRQPGSGFKPFVYAAAFDKGYTAASVLLDAPLVFDGRGVNADWRPKEDDGQFHGRVRLREALAKSRNLVSVRLVRAIGVKYTRDYVTRFGFARTQIPEDLTMALGTAALSPLEVAAGYAAFANGGFKVTPYYIDRIDDGSGRTVQQANPAMACARCRPPSQKTAPQIIRPQVAYLLADMMKDVIRSGTGAAARVLNRDDIAGKTGTSNVGRDAWFSGFNGDLETTVWTGFDQDRNLGDREFGASAALPIWVAYMREALASAPRHDVPVPEGIVSARISPLTGRVVSADDPDGIMEQFIVGTIPGVDDSALSPNSVADGGEPLF